MMFSSLTAALALLFMQAAAGPHLSPSDAAAVRATTQAYRDAWIANDASRVMATLAPDAVLLPSGLAPIQGSAR